MNKTTATLADGREIFFFDDQPTERTVEDPRDIEFAGGGSELRWDPFLSEYVAVAAARQNRTHKPAADLCPLCPSTDEKHTEIPQESYDVVAFENRFPSFSGGRGRCEVVCFTPDHTTSLGQLDATRLRTVVDAWADRTRALLGNYGVKQVYCFENRGEEIGVTLHHPHGQIYGYPFVTPRTEKMLDSAARYRDEHGKDLFAVTLAQEQESGERVVSRNEHWTAFIPHWARWPVEVHIYPHRGVGTLPELTDAERDAFAELYLEVLRAGDQLFATDLPYIAGWQQAPVDTTTDFRLHLQLFSIRRDDNKLKYLAGSESGMGVFINDIPPEQMAQRLREAAKKA